MINFFREIRKKLADDNKPLKYARYAVGEIVLVVIGILIALSINNWNESKKNSREEFKLLLNLERDFASNMKFIDTGLNNHHLDLAYQKSAVRNTGPNAPIPTQAILDSIGSINYTIVELVYGSINPTFNPNRIELLNNENLRAKIADFMVALAKYKEAEEESKKIAIELRKIHQSYIWLMEEHLWTMVTNNSKNIQTDSDYEGWLRDRNHQNRAADRTGAINVCIRQLTALKSQVTTILDLIKGEINQYEN